MRKEDLDSKVIEFQLAKSERQHYGGKELVLEDGEIVSFFDNDFYIRHPTRSNYEKIIKKKIRKEEDCRDNDIKHPFIEVEGIINGLKYTRKVYLSNLKNIYHFISKEGEKKESPILS